MCLRHHPSEIQTHPQQLTEPGSAAYSRQQTPAGEEAKGALPVRVICRVLALYSTMTCKCWTRAAAALVVRQWARAACDLHAPTAGRTLAGARRKTQSAWRRRGILWLLPPARGQAAAMAFPLSLHGVVWRRRRCLRRAQARRQHTLPTHTARWAARRHAAARAQLS